MALPLRSYITSDEYLELERDAEFRSEYYNGEVFEMSGASEPHNMIAVIISSLLYFALKGTRCRVYQTDLRLHIVAQDRYMYPDVMVVCGERKFYDNQKDVLLNPAVIFEILSPTTESYDRGDKFAAYRTIPSLREYILVRQDRAGVEKFTKNADGFWVLSEANGPDGLLELTSIGVTLKLAEMYEGVFA